MKSSPLDTWGNVKVPSIEHYENESQADDEGWYDTQGGNYNTYSSIIGIPMSGTNSSEFVDYSMKIQTNYLHLECLRPEDGSQSISVLPDGVFFSGYDIRTQVWWVDDTRRRVNTALGDLKPFVFGFMSSVIPDMHCSMTTTYVELDIICPTSSTCSAARMRRFLLEHPPSAWTSLDMVSYENATNSVARTNWDAFIDRFLAMGEGASKYLNQLDY
jgi:hypothetical protein